jgi:hypothetical protein
LGIKNIPGQGPTPPAPGAEPGPAEAQKTQKTPQPTSPASDPGRAAPPLPPADSSVRGKTSPLSGVITEGLTKLARAEGWEAQQNALDVLVGAMMKGRPSAREEGPRADAMSAMAFESLLTQHAPAEQRAAARKDARQLASLAVVALGTEGLRGQRKADQGAQLKTDLEEIHRALGDVIGSPDPGRTERLERVASDLEWVASVLGRSAGAKSAQPRVDAVAGMLKILLRYA